MALDIFSQSHNHRIILRSQPCSWCPQWVSIFVVVVFVFNVPPTAKVIWRRGHGLKSHPTDW